MKKGILPEDIYGMDESGFPLSGNTAAYRCVGRRGVKVQHIAGSGDKENVTAIVTICADGTALTPTIIYKGQNFMQKWNDNNVAHASICHSQNGWTDLLLMDGHSSHFTPELLGYAMENKISILGYPPHCTHVSNPVPPVLSGELRTKE
ncbi:hypothetical protein BV22DRAFT_1108007 [Leucogyrophana mollusca]|uniref:Uncharacterized protein n=1 Tax=Leucogyrophana mollusca TaxID=85980 RepID=A0ACB8B261_9AGAM|nr:hypothetical protein BV22DRAFT_1108007 [Leucogyrophana mollusca]